MDYCFKCREYIPNGQVCEKCAEEVKRDNGLAINEFATEVHDNARAHGWWDKPISLPEAVALMHSELSEALQAYRNGDPVMWFECMESGDEHRPCDPEDEFDCLNYKTRYDCKYRSAKPEGVAVEFADCIIRILDYMAYLRVDVEDILTAKHEYNKTREYRHGGKII